MSSSPLQRTIELRRERISYTLRTSRRARRMRLNLYGDGSVVVTRPWGLDEFFVNRFIVENTDWVLKKLRALKQFGRDLSRGEHRRFKDYQDQAFAFVHARIAFWNQFYHFSFVSIRVRNQKTRWGSCSSKRTLSFNFKILFLPTHVADYIIVHELCHLKELNHSPAFWRLVARTIPNYNEIRKSLRMHTII